MNNSNDFILPHLAAQARILEIVSSRNGKLTIEETDKYRWIRDDNNAYYSVLDKAQAARLVLPYLQTMLAALLFVPKPESYLLLGAGGGALLRFFSENIPNCTMTAIDYDQTLIELTNKYFLTDNLRDCKITENDANSYVAQSTSDDFDMIFIDLFGHGGIPDFFNEKFFYENCKKKCTNGVVIYNLIINDEISFKKIFTIMLSVFNNRCLCLTVADYKNIIVLAFSEKIPIQRNVTELRNIANHLTDIYQIDFTYLIDELVLTNVCENNELQI